MRQLSLVDELVIDLFAGGGGASTGIEQAIGRSVDYAINHDPEAIAMHKANHPDTIHYQTSIFEVDPREVAQGRPVGLLWLSPDCTHFSKAKGGQPRSKKIRALCWVGLRWAHFVRPRVIMLENVEEFQTMGPLLSNGQPDPDTKGKGFDGYINAYRKMGYAVEYRTMIACDYGAPTSRKRFFMIARCDGQPIVWPDESHALWNDPRVKSGELKPYRVAAECIDFSLPCPSIFERKRPLKENTLRRIARGIQKYVLGEREPFIVTLNHGGDNFRGQGLDEPFKTLTASRDAHGLVDPILAPIMIQTGWGERKGQDPRCLDIMKPIGTMPAEGVKHSIACAKLMLNYGGNYDGEGLELNDPLATVTAKGHHSLLAVTLDRQFGNSGGASVGEPLPSTTADGGGHSALVLSHLSKFYGTCTGSSMKEPVPTVTGGGQHLAEVRAFLLKYYGKGSPHSILKPTDTLTTKDRFGIVQVFNQDYLMVDIGLRMLKPHEQFKAQGFPDDYIIAPEFNKKPLTQTAQTRMCGNSVPPPFARALVMANYRESRIKRKRA